MSDVVRLLVMFISGFSVGYLASGIICWFPKGLARILGIVVVFILYIGCVIAYY